jgi:hypothetical protein
MAIKDWVSRFVLGTGIDTPGAGDMETLVDNIDRTRAAQPHALRDALIEVEKQVLGAPWFVWNEADLTQFDAAIAGSDTSGTGATVVTLAGVNWISMPVTIAVSTTDFLKSAFVLPITAAPPTNNYLITAQYNLAASGSGAECGAFVGGRYDSVSSGYFAARQKTGTGSTLEQTKAFVDSTIGPTLNDPSPLIVGSAVGRLALVVRGVTDVLLEHGKDPDTGVLSLAASSPLITGKCCIGNVVQAVTNTTIRMRDIRCYTLIT